MLTGPPLPPSAHVLASKSPKPRVAASGFQLAGVYPLGQANFIKSTMANKKENIKFLMHANCAKQGMFQKHLLYKCYKAKTHTLSTGFSTLKFKVPFPL